MFSSDNLWTKLDKKGFREDILTKQSHFSQERLTGSGQETLTILFSDVILKNLGFLGRYFHMHGVQFPSPAFGVLNNYLPFL